MILPSKHLSEERALLTIGGHVLGQLARPQTVSAVWEKFNSGTPGLDYPTFVFTLDLLYLLGAIELRDGLLHRRAA